MQRRELPPPMGLRRLSERLPKRDSPTRFWMHFPVGVLTIFAILISPLAAVMAFIAFLAYEIVEDWKIGDHAYIDIAGYTGGIWLGIVVLFLLQVFEIIGTFQLS